MHTRSNLHILYTILVVMVAQAHCDQFMCYVCDNCPQITENTPTKACDESYFNQDTTLPTTISTSPTTEKPTTVTETTTSTTTVETTETTISEGTESTSPGVPTPPTAGPVETTTTLPTPPNTGTVAAPIDADFAQFEETTTTTGSTFSTESTDTQETTIGTTLLEPVRIIVDPVQIRGRRSVSNQYSEFTYHCYTVQQMINGTETTSRGCARITFTESLCNQLEQANNNTKFSTCSPCSNTLCNSSTAVSTSMVAIIVGLLAALLFRTSA